MNRQEFACLAMAMRTYYPRENLLPNDEALELWFDALQEVDGTAAGAALKIWAKKNRFAPTIADIIETSKYAQYEAAIEAARVERLTAAEDRKRIAQQQGERKVPDAVQHMLSSIQEMLQKEAKK